MESFNLQIRISTAFSDGLKAFKDLAAEVKNLQGAALAASQAINKVGQSLDSTSKQLKKFGRDFTQNVTAPLLALAGLSLKKVFDEAVLGNGSAATNQFAGAVQALKKEFDLLLITIGTQLAPVATRVVSFFRNIISAFQSLSPETKNIIINFGLFAAAIGPIALALASFIGIAGKLILVLAPLVTLFGQLAGFLISPAGAIAAIAVGLAGLIKTFIDLRKAGVSGAEAFIQSFSLAANAFGNFVVKPILKGIQWIIDGINKITPSFNYGLKAATQAASDGVGDIIKSIETSFDSNTSGINKSLATIGSSLGNTFTLGLKNGLASAGSAFDGLTTAAAAKVQKTFAPLDDSFDEAIRRYRQFKDDITNQERAVGENISGGLTNAFLDFAEGAKTAEQAFADFARSTIRYIADMILKQLLFNALFGKGGPLTGLASGVVGAANNKATGGYVRGPGSSTSDSIMTRLSDGEYVTDAKTVRTLGVDFFRGLKSMARGGVPYKKKSAIPHFADGGLVGSGMGGSAPQVVVQNSGSPKESTGSSFDPASGVTTVILEDIQKNGSISKAMQRNFGFKRQGFR